MTELNISDVRLLEEMVIDCIYEGLLSAKMDNKQQQMTVDYVTTRDFKIEETEMLFDKLMRLFVHVGKVEKTLEERLEDVNKTLEEKRKNELVLNKRISEAYSIALNQIVSENEVNNLIKYNAGFKQQ